MAAALPHELPFVVTVRCVFGLIVPSGTSSKRRFPNAASVTTARWLLSTAFAIDHNLS
jgi:hypothetical protein